MDTPAAPQPAVPDLPDDLTVRPLSIGDAPAVHQLLAAEEQHDLGLVEIEEADVVADWQRPSWNISTGTVGAFADGDDGPVLVGYAEVTYDQHGCAAVHVDHRGRGIGTALARWMQAAARSQGMERIGMPVPRGSAGDRLLEELGYDVRWESWLLELPEDAAVPERSLPAGCRVREARAGEHEAVWTLNENAFLEWADRPRMPFGDWRAHVTDRPGFEPWHLRVCTAGEADGSGQDGADDEAAEVIGMLFLQVARVEGTPEAFVAKLATRADRRGEGVAQALLADAFGEARSRGIARCTLSTDSRTGALGLYEKLGMRLASTWHHRSVTL